VSLLLVIAGAAVGAPLRYLSDRAIQSNHDSVFPWGTLTVNVVGSLILGILTGAVTAGGASPQVQLAVGTGFCGALTTYSTFSYETLRLLEDDARLFAAVNVVASIVAGLVAAFLGVAIGQAIWS
jgi:CrcB protein